MKKAFIILSMVLFFVFMVGAQNFVPLQMPTALAYDTASSATGSISKTGTKKPVHQKLTKEAIEFWNDAPQAAKDEFALYSSRDIYGKIDPVGLVNFDLNNSGYLGKVKADDLISGSAEEDNVKNPADFNETCDSNDGMNGFFEHFWDPDIPWQVGFNCNSGDGMVYNFGLPKVKELTDTTVLYTKESYISLYFNGIRTYDSGYRLAKDIWDHKIIPLKPAYKNDPAAKREAYYWLGRIAHLLQDQTVPAHVHTRYHDPLINRGKDYYESYANTVIDNYVYSDAQYAGQYYKYEDLIPGFPWTDLIPGGLEPNNFFKLFWYTAQKTQYFASNTPAVPGIDRVKGNDSYRKSNLNDSQRVTFAPSLWAGENITPISDPSLVAANLNPISNALIPHALKATAGLYRLFWDTMHDTLK